MPRFFALLIFIAANMPAFSAEPTVWTQWRGPGRDGRVSESAERWPGTLSEASVQKSWTAKFGPSYSGPIVLSDRVIVTETSNRTSEVVRALDRKSGKELWKAEWKGAMTVPFFANSNGSWIRATPACDGKRLYVAGMRDVLVCLDAATGKEFWRVDFVKQYRTKLPAFGFASSPLVSGNSVYVQAGEGVVRLDKRTGKVLWRVLKDGGGMFGSAFSSPVIAKIRGMKQLVVQTRQKLAGLDLETGKVYWSVTIPAFRGMNILTPTVIGDRVFTSSYGGKSLLFDIKRSTTEEWTASPLWTAKLQAYMSSPVVIDGHIYLHLKNQRFACLAVADGKICWITSPFGKYWSMVVQGRTILALDETGELLLIRANPDRFELLQRRKISDEPTWAHLAVCGQEVFVRGLKTMSAFRWKNAKP